MPDQMPTTQAKDIDSNPNGLTVHVVQNITEIDPAEWDTCAGDDNPFVSHAYLSALELSGSVSENAGFKPMHVAIRDASGRLVGAAPTYVKANSNGEYGPDIGWPEAHERNVGRYYPKLQVEVPFTPVAGPRLLAAPETDQMRVKKALLRALMTVGSRLRLSSLHVNYASHDDWDLMGDVGLLLDGGLQLHWRNDGYESFDDFTKTLRARRRTAIKAERRCVPDNHLTVEGLRGEAITEREIRSFYAFYSDTNRRYGAPLLLNEEFFQRLANTMSDRLLLSVARQGTEMIGAVLHVLGPDRIYTRYWGSSAKVKHLHFELSYYQAIDYAIRHGIASIDGGSGGPHKVARGYLPVDVFHAHYAADKGFRQAARAFTAQKLAGLKSAHDELMKKSPFKVGAEPGSPDR